MNFRRSFVLNPERSDTRAVGGAYKFMRDAANRDEVVRIAAGTTGAPRR